jgi:hypothetical protein
LSSQNFNFFGNGTLHKPVTEGEISIILSHNNSLILNNTLSLCRISEPYYPCPIKQQKISFNSTFNYPASLLSYIGEYVGEIEMKAEENQELSCFQFKFSVKH